MVTESHQGRLVERIASGHAIVVLCAPPGFGKSGLAREAARRLSVSGAGSVREYGELEHSADPRAVANTLLSDQQQIVVIEDVHLADLRFLSLALERSNFDGGNQRVFVVLHQSSDLALARMSSRRSMDYIDANALRLRPQEIADALKSISNTRTRARVRNLSGDWPIALELLCSWAAGSQDYDESWSDLDIVRESRLGEFIDQEILPLFSPNEASALVHASLLDAPDLGILTGIVGHEDDGRVLADLAFRFKGLVDRRGDRIHLQSALRVWLRASERHVLAFFNLPCARLIDASCIKRNMRL